MPKLHRYHIVHEPDADFIVLETQEMAPFWGGFRPQWVERTRWMIPGTYIGEAA